MPSEPTSGSGPRYPHVFAVENRGSYPQIGCGFPNLAKISANRMRHLKIVKFE
ncbi:hypothetical protein SISSUDRAFT_1054748 [Sistotremastrum suecicum HHB10207 ss-3]|uniref:Uncharacterized protein n=1 Tax=Sistotremastrum suecicum HHB10207 ss-3 TaxID=1314776 RepID=A0A165Y8Y2_9AGAM|nr:hypothetical protein SISSUDRAFT_1054748 [Sistotremastrum suecicum HHB10207 ss-3]